jgi:hypothetical protein
MIIPLCPLCLCEKNKGLSQTALRLGELKVPEAGEDLGDMGVVNDT